MCLRDLRVEFGLSQQEAARIAGIPLRTYVRYESEEDYGDSLKRKMIMNELREECEITEEKGLLTVEKITEIVSGIIVDRFQDEVEFCYLFGSYAKGYAKEGSDVDLCVSTSLTGFRFAGLVEILRGALHKKVDVIRLDTLKNNVELLSEIMKDGIKIYG